MGAGVTRKSRYRRKARLNVEGMIAFDAQLQYANAGIQTNVSNAIDYNKAWSISFFFYFHPQPAGIQGIQNVVGIWNEEGANISAFQVGVMNVSGNYHLGIFIANLITSDYTVQYLANPAILPYRLYHGVINYSPVDNVEIYVNSLKKDLTRQGNTLSASWQSDAPLMIGCTYEGSNMYGGGVSHLCFFNRIQTLPEISYAMQQGGHLSASLHSACVAHYPGTQRGGNILMDIVRQYNYAKVTPLQAFHADLINYTSEGKTGGLQTTWRNFYTKQPFHALMQEFTGSLQQRAQADANLNLDKVIDYNKQFSVTAVIHITKVPANFSEYHVFAHSKQIDRQFALKIKNVSGAFGVQFYENAWPEKLEFNASLPDLQQKFEVGKKYHVYADREKIIINGKLAGTRSGASGLTYSYINWAGQPQTKTLFAFDDKGINPIYSSFGIETLCVYNRVLTQAEALEDYQREGSPARQLHGNVIAHYVPDTENLRMVDLVEQYNYAKPIVEIPLQTFDTEYDERIVANGFGTIALNAGTLECTATGTSQYGISIEDATMPGFSYRIRFTAINLTSKVVAFRYSFGGLGSVFYDVQPGQSVTVDRDSSALGFSNDFYLWRVTNSPGATDPIVIGEKFAIDDFELIPEVKTLAPYHAALQKFTTPERLVANPNFDTDLTGWNFAVVNIGADTMAAELSHDPAGHAVITVTSGSTVENSRLVLETPFYSKAGEWVRIRVRLKWNRTSNRHVYSILSSNAIYQPMQTTDFSEYEFLHQVTVDTIALRLNVTSKPTSGTGIVDTIQAGDVCTVDYLDAIPLRTERGLVDRKSLLPSLSNVIAFTSTPNGPYLRKNNFTISNEAGYTVHFVIRVPSGRDFITSNYDRFISIYGTGEGIQIYGEAVKNIKVAINLGGNSVGSPSIALSSTQATEQFMIVTLVMRPDLKAQLFVNHQKSSVWNLTALPDFNNLTLTVGSHASFFTWQEGQMAAVYIGKGVLTYKQHLHMYNNGLLARPEKKWSNVEWFCIPDFGEFIDGTTVRDVSGKGNDLTLQNYSVDQIDPEHADYALKPLLPILLEAGVTEPEPEYDYYISPTGSDLNDGTGSTDDKAFASLDALQSIYDAMQDGETVKFAVLAGTYEGSIITPISHNTYVNETILEIHCIGKVVFDNSGIVGAAQDTVSFIDAGGSATCKIFFFGEENVADRTEITCGNALHANNAFGASDSGKLYAYRADVHGYYDGVSSHNTSHIFTDDVIAYDCGKSCYAMVNSSTYEFNNSKFIGKTAMVASAAYSEINTSGVLNNCEIYNAAGEIDCKNFTLKSAVFNNCKIGKLNQGTLTANLYGDFENSTFNDCFINIRFQHYLNTVFNRCYGILTVRPNGPATDTLDINHCVFKLGFDNNSFVNMNFHSEPNSIGGSVTVRNSIFIDHATKVFNAGNNATRAGYINTNWQILFNAFFNNTAIADAGITIITDSVTADPLLNNPNTEDQDDWKVLAGSPCIGAGQEGEDIGLGTVTP